MGERSVEPEIEVDLVDRTDEVSAFHVRVTDDRSTAAFDVTLSRRDRERLPVAYPSERAFIRACFEFLLERENKGSILRSFDIGVISTYFPEFERTIVR